MNDALKEKLLSMSFFLIDIKQWKNWTWIYFYVTGLLLRIFSYKNKQEW